MNIRAAARLSLRPVLMDFSWEYLSKWILQLKNVSTNIQWGQGKIYRDAYMYVVYGTDTNVDRPTDNIRIFTRERNRLPTNEIFYEQTSCFKLLRPS